jgi:hypothetical protein
MKNKELSCSERYFDRSFCLWGVIVVALTMLPSLALALGGTIEGSYGKADKWVTLKVVWIVFL